jgi:UDP-N-acetylglucosamine 2-epimerase (non-hydrolysing)
MNYKRKIITLVSTRPDIIKLSCIIKEIEKFFENILVNTNQNFNYELNEIFFKEMNIKKPKYFFKSKNKSPIQNISEMLIEFEKICELEKPDALIVLGDTNSSLLTYVAKRKKIPIFHLEAGNRCHDQRVPEELNRKIVDHLSDINLTYSKVAKENLISEGFASDQVFTIGSPIKEVYNCYKKKISKSNILKKLNLKKKSFYLISFHREENVENLNKITNFFKFLEYLEDHHNLPVIVSTHYRLQKKILENKKLKSKKFKNVKFLKPFGYFDYCQLLNQAKIVFSDSGTITEESSVMKFKAINLRETNERQEGFEEGIAPMTGLNLKNIDTAINILSNKNYTINPVKDYEINNVSSKVVKILISYIDYINHKVWKKFL